VVHTLSRTSAFAAALVAIAATPSLADARAPHVSAQAAAAATAAFPGSVKACRRNDERKVCASSMQEGTLGTGPVFTVRSRMTKFQGGLVEGSNLYVGFGEKSVYTTELIAVYAVDLVTGNRKVISGTRVTNPNDEYKSQTLATVGTGPSFGIMSSIRRLRPGKLLVSGYNGLFVVDEATGNRELVVASISQGEGCFKNSAGTIDLTSDGKVVVAGEGGPTSGIQVFDIATKRCKVIASHGSTPATSVGSGAEFPGSRFSNVVRSATDPNVFYAQHWAQSGIWSVNIATGARQIVSKKSGADKRGNVPSFMQGMPVTTAGKIWWSTDESGVQEGGLMSIDTSSGDAAYYSSKEGPSADLTTLGVPVPSDPRWVVFAGPLRSGIAMLDTQSKSSVWVSY